MPRGRPKGSRNKPKVPVLQIAGAPLPGGALLKKLESIIDARIAEQIEAIGAVLVPKLMSALDAVTAGFGVVNSTQARVTILEELLGTLRTVRDERLIPAAVTKRIAAVWRERLALNHIDEALTSLGGAER